MYIYSPNIDIFITYISMPQGDGGEKREEGRGMEARGERAERGRGERGEGRGRERKGEGEKERHR